VGKALPILALAVGVPVGATAVVAACTVQTIFPFGTGPLPGSASQMVGPAGGLVTANDGTTLLIPPQALAGDVTITVALDPDTAELPGARALGAAHFLGPAGQTFSKPVCVTVSFEPALLPSGTTETNVVLYATQGDGGYAPVTTLTADPTHVTGMISLFSTVVAAYGSAEEADASDANCDANQLDGGEEP